MSKVYRSLLEVCWGVGLICMVGSIVLRLLPMLQDTIGISPRGGMMLAAILFLCAIATGEARRALPSS
ncbi:MAG: hypothetical protein ABSH01_23800 [Terriglobia bacterium]|jgi:uncharacterized membrane protein YgdD (TMEM256/DUF423 family)